MNKEVVVFKHFGYVWEAEVNDCGINACMVTIVSDLRFYWEKITDTSLYGLTINKQSDGSWEI